MIQTVHNQGRHRFVINFITIPPCTRATKNAPDRSILCQGRINLIRGATLIHGHCRALTRIPTYPWPLTWVLRRRILGELPLTAPSAVHLTICFTPDSQQHRLSVVASSPLSPLQRFELWNYRYYKYMRRFCQLFFLCTRFIFYLSQLVTVKFSLMYLGKRSYEKIQLY